MLTEYVGLSSIHPFVKTIDWADVFLMELEPSHLLLHGRRENKFHIGGLLVPVPETFLDLLGDPQSILVLLQIPQKHEYQKYDPLLQNTNMQHIRIKR